MSRADQAWETFQGPYNCTQSVFAAFAPGLGLEREAALRVASGLGGGVGCLGSEVCGAVSGAVLAIGLSRAYLPEDRAAREATYALVREFARRFRVLHGHLRCRDLLGLDIGTPEGRQAALDSGLHDILCPRLVRDAAAIVEELLALQADN
ncbi:MAG: C_GCAxxG_C_C family protein [Anaerolineae bacterium]|nr:C_GCAxxG_C_C family protein [Anaerolineae bacterium]